MLEAAVLGEATALSLVLLFCQGLLMPPLPHDGCRGREPEPQPRERSASPSER